VKTINGFSPTGLATGISGNDGLARNQMATDKVTSPGTGVEQETQLTHEVTSPITEAHRI
jgi:hypothetical protein